MIDLYCERVGPGLFAEPLNASTNLLFLLAAWCCWRLPREGHGTDTGVLTGTVFAIGIGSGLFHTFATPWAEVLDVIPLAFLQLAYLWLYLRSVVAVDRAPAAGLVGGFAAAMGVCALFPGVLNGSLAYLPAAATVLLIAARQYAVRAPGAPSLIAAAVIFAVSLGARTADNMVCEQWPWGTHFIWHSLNALVVYLLVRAYVLNVDARNPPEPDFSAHAPDTDPPATPR